MTRIQIEEDGDELDLTNADRSGTEEDDLELRREGPRRKCEDPTVKQSRREELEPAVVVAGNASLKMRDANLILESQQSIERIKMLGE